MKAAEFCAERNAELTLSLGMFGDHGNMAWRRHWPTRHTPYPVQVARRLTAHSTYMVERSIPRTSPWLKQFDRVVGEAVQRSCVQLDVYHVQYRGTNLRRLHNLFHHHPNKLAASSTSHCPHTVACTPSTPLEALQNTACYSGAL